MIGGYGSLVNEAEFLIAIVPGGDPLPGAVFGPFMGYNLSLGAIEI